MATDAFLYAFAAAWLHGSANVYLGRRPQPEAASAVMIVTGVLAFAPFAIVFWRVQESAIPYIAASAALELGYFAFLAAAYRASEVSLVYPVARGTAPVLVLIGAALFLSRGASAGQIAGVVTVGSGIMLVRGLGVARGGSEGRGFALALATGVFIAGYTLVDKQGLEHAGPIAYLELVQLGPALCYASAITRLRGLGTVRSELTPRVCVVGVILFGNYLLVLLALRLASAASVSAVRETSVVVASGLAALVTRERVSPVRFVGAVLVAAGIALVALSS